MAFHRFALLLLPLALCACQHADRQKDNGALAPTTGHGRLLSVNQKLGIGTLEINGKVVNFWWDNKVERAAAAVTPSSSLDPIVIDVPFNADIGDTIYFKGYTSRGEVFITAATTVKAAANATPHAAQ